MASTRIDCPVARAARHHGARLALVASRRGEEILRLSWQQLEDRVSATVDWLRDQGVGAGDRVSWCSSNHPGMVYLASALPRLDAVGVPLNVRLTSAELAPLRARIGARLNLEARAVELLESWLNERGAQPRGAGGTVDLQRTHFVLFTSGTTGQPKGACLSLRALMEGAEASALRLGTPREERWLCTLPLFHVGGLAMIYRAARAGGALVLHDRFDADQVRKVMVDESITHLSLVDTTLRRLLEAPGPWRFSPSLQAVLVGGGPVSERRLEEGRERGLPLLQTYGLTETASQVCTQLLGDLRCDDAGPPLNGSEVRVVDDAGNPVGFDVVGQLQVRGPTLFEGYLDDASATAAAFTTDGWFKTGDLGAVDAHGRVRLLSRRSDLIIRGGENVYPAEVERVLLAFPGVAEAVVLPRADAIWGQVPVAYISLSDASVELRTLEAFCGERLARFKRPERIVVLPALPRNALGKIDRTSLQ